MATSTIPVKSAGTVLFTIQAALNSVIVNGPSTNVASKYGGTVYVRIGRTSSASGAPTGSGAASGKRSTRRTMS